jgi:hypothetical protein
MSRILASLAALALLVVLALSSPAMAAERRADGLRANDQAMTDVSAYYRRWGWRGAYWGRPYWRARYAYWGPRYYAYPYPYWRPRYAFYRPFWRPWRPYWRPWRVGYGYGFYGRRWWW